jgi:hypothetical protein
MRLLSGNPLSPHCLYTLTGLWAFVFSVNLNLFNLNCDEIAFASINIALYFSSIVCPRRVCESRRTYFEPYQCNNCAGTF